MAQQFVKGRTNNHLTWVMVDSTDFATPESALSAATKITIYGKTAGATGVNTVAATGTGSLTNDIQHVGPSVLGIYTIALAKADLSDASAAWYDQYVITLSATGAAYQTIIVDGGIHISQMLAYSDMISNAYSAAVVGASRALLAQSYASDAFSAAVLTQSLASDAHSAAVQTNSRVLLIQSRLSDLDSRLVSDISDIRSELSDLHSDMSSKFGAITVTITASDISDIASAVVAGLPITSQVSDILSAIYIVQSMASDAASAAAQTNSRVLLVQSRLSDLGSLLASNVSDIQSALTAIYSGVSNINSATVVAPDLSDIASAVLAEFSDTISNILSAIAAGGGGATTSAIAAKVWSDYGSKVGQTPSQVYSNISNMLSYLSGISSDLNSRITKPVATNSQLSDLHSDLRSYLIVMSAVQSDLTSALSDFQSDFQSRVPKLVATSSQLSDIGSDIVSDLKSFAGTTGVFLNASALSDIGSAVLAAAAANPIDANIQEINDVALVGDGNATPWGPV